MLRYLLGNNELMAVLTLLDKRAPTLPLLANSWFGVYSTSLHSLHMQVNLDKIPLVYVWILF